MERPVERTISMKDVRDLVRQVEQEYNVDVRFEIKPGPRSTTKFDWWVTVWSEPRVLAKGAARTTHHQQHQWPSIKAKTLAGLMYALLWQLERILGEERLDRERSSGGQLALPI